MENLTVIWFLGIKIRVDFLCDTKNAISLCIFGYLRIKFSTRAINKSIQLNNGDIDFFFFVILFKWVYCKKRK